MTRYSPSRDLMSRMIDVSASLQEALAAAETGRESRPPLAGKGTTMNRGHEDCWRSSYTPTGFAKGGIMPHNGRCDRAHMEEVRADDGLGTGPVVADYCQCCDTIIRRDDYR